MKARRWIRIAAGSIVVTALAGCVQRSYPAIVTKVDGQTVCFRSHERADEVRLPAGEGPADALKGPEASWYRAGQCIEIRNITEGAWGRVVGETDCPADLPPPGTTTTTR